MVLKVLSVRQPYAYLIIYGGKDVENRTWRTHYRGRLYIHSPSFQYSDYITSAIIGYVDLVDVISDSDSKWAEENQWHWVLKNPVAIEPIKNIKGKLGVWDYEFI